MALKKTKVQFNCEETGTLIEVDPDNQDLKIFIDTDLNQDQGVLLETEDLEAIFEALGWPRDAPKDCGNCECGDDEVCCDCNEDPEAEEETTTEGLSALQDEVNALKEHARLLKADNLALSSKNVSLSADHVNAKRMRDQAEEDLWQTKKQLEVVASQYGGLLVGLSNLVHKLGIKNASGINCVTALERYVEMREPPVSMIEFLDHCYRNPFYGDRNSPALECGRKQQVGDVIVTDGHLIDWAKAREDAKNFTPPEAT